MNKNTDSDGQFDLTFRNAWFQMLNGKHVALKSWGGYWV